MRKRYLIGAMSLALAGMLLCGCAGKEGEERNRDRQETESTSGREEAGDGELPQEGAAGKEAPENTVKVSFEGQDMEGNTVSSDIFPNSRLTMINVWATYCNPCLREMPELAQLTAEYTSEDFQLIGIISDVQEGADQSVMEEAAQLIEQTGADYPHLLLNESIYYGMLTDVMAVPTTFFVDSEGNILDTVVGAMDKKSWEEKIDELLEDL